MLVKAQENGQREIEASSYRQEIDRKLLRETNQELIEETQVKECQHYFRINKITKRSA